MWRQMFAALLLSIWTSDSASARSIKNYIVEFQEAFNQTADVIETKLTSLSQAIQALPSTIEELVQKRLDNITGALAQNDVMETKLNQAIQALPSTIEELVQKGLDKITGPTHPSRSYDKFARDDEGYLLAFRLTAGIRESAYSKYGDVGNNDDESDLMHHSVPCGCKTTNGSLFCDRHYRSMLLDLWPRIPVEKVKLSLYQNGVEQRRFVFDGKNSDSLSFFQQARLQEDPYTDLSAFEPSKPAPNFFSIAGNGGLSRRFFINNKYAGCQKDVGWLVVGDGPSHVCPWEQWHQNKYPFVLYANTASAVPIGAENYMKSVWQTGKVAEADVLTISIKLREKEQCQL